YPDWGFAGLLYFLRIRGNLFCDIGSVSSNEANYQLRDANNTIFNAYKPSSLRNLGSVGAELIFDVRIFNAVQFPFLFRYNYNLNKSNLLFNEYEISVPIRQL
ncbi:MAG: hypothetical protein ACKVOU_01565, partial [Cytophagales bacterium]